MYMYVCFVVVDWWHLGLSQNSHANFIIYARICKLHTDML